MTRLEAPDWLGSIVSPLSLVCLVVAIAAASLFSLSFSAHAASPETRQKLLYGPTIQIDPVYSYYQGRSADSIADELSHLGYQTVHLIITSEANVNGELIDALHRKGIAVWGMVWGSGTYSTVGYPPEWPEWRQTLIKPADLGGFIFLSPFHPDWRAFKKKMVTDLVRNYPIDGFEIIESFWPNWNGLQNGAYGDVGPWAAKAFKEKTGEEMPNFTDPSNPRYYTKVPELFRKWTDFRVQAETDWVNELINGPGGVRSARPDIVIATWTLSTDHPDALQKSRVDIGEDSVLMIQAVKPDMHFFQTNWPDWLKKNLSPTYPHRYKQFVDAVRAVAPDLPIGLQADIGSVPDVRREWSWIRTFEKESVKAGFATDTLYEYHIGKYMYSETPRVVASRRGSDGWVLLSFNKRIDDFTGSDTENYRVLNVPDASVQNVVVDGNIAMVEIENIPTGAFEIEISNVEDTPEHWLIPGQQAKTVPNGHKVAVPAAQ